MARPLLITDCDEVLLHMVGHFRDWLAEAHDVTFTVGGNDFANSMRRADGSILTERAMWSLLGGFFDSQMHRQTAIAGAIEGINDLARDADVVMLTNLNDERQDVRRRQMADHGLDIRVFTNQGPKGPALARIVAEYRPSRAVFIDDIASHHASAAERVPAIARLHLCGEPELAPHIACAHQAGHADARIDQWEEALPWLKARLFEEEFA